MYPSQDPTRKAWQGMMNRCYTTTNKDYPKLGGAGIKVHPAWHDYNMFAKDMGEKPENCRLTRHCDGLDFTPDNCFWNPVTNYAKTREYTIWKGIRRRCGIVPTSQNHKPNKLYADKAIYMCEDWVDDFPVFFAYVGQVPDPSYSLDRIDNNKGYEPGNVRWATPKEQANNRSDNVWIEMHGERKTLQEWCDYYYADRSTVSSRWVNLFTATKSKNNPCAQYDMQGNHIADYVGTKAAAEATGINQGTIAKCLSGGNASAGGYKWKYIK